jgi:hypothetical protein
MLTSKITREQDAIPKVVVDNSEFDLTAALLLLSVATCTFRVTDSEMAFGDGLFEDRGDGVSGYDRRLVSMGT